MERMVIGPRPKFIAGNTYDWPKPVADMVLRAFENNMSLFEFNRLNYRHLGFSHGFVSEFASEAFLMSSTTT